MVTIEMPTTTEIREIYARTGSAVEIAKAFVRAEPTNIIECFRRIREAFGLGLVDVKPLGGWWPGMHEELSDARIDELLVPAIEAARPRWDKN